MITTTPTTGAITGRTTGTTSGTRRRLRVAVALAGGALAIVATSDTGRAEPAESPAKEDCAFADHPVAIDLVPLLPSTMPVDEGLQAILRGEVPAGSPCGPVETTHVDPAPVDTAPVDDPAAGCEFADHPAAADLAPLLPSTMPVGEQLQEVLRGEVPVGDRCMPSDPSSTGVEPVDWPTWDECRFADHPVAADAGGIPSVDLTPAPERSSELGPAYDCSLFDLPV